MAVKRGSSSNGVVAAAILMTVVVCAITGFLGLYLVNPGDIFNKQDSINAEDQVLTKLPETTLDANGNEIPFQEALNNSTTLVFGDQDSSNVVTLITDPEELSRDKNFINGRPSEFLTLVQKGDIRLNLLLKPSTPERAIGVESIQKAATCRYYSDNSTTAIYTLNGIVAAASKMTGAENIDQARELMGMVDISCPADSENNAIINGENAKVFSGLLNAGDKPVLVAGGGITTNIQNLDEKWQEGIKLGMNISNFDSGEPEEDELMETTATNAEEIDNSETSVPQPEDN